jgi:hypothetical protein
MKKIVLVFILFIFTGQEISAQCNTGISGTLTSCAANCNGSVTFTSTTGTPPYNLVVTGGPTVQYTSSYTWTSVCPGSYHYDVTDATLSCHDTGTVTVTAIVPTVPPPLIIEAYDLLGVPLGSNPTICQFQHIDFFVQLPFTNILPNTFTWKINGVPALVQTNVANYLNASWSTSTLATGDCVVLEISWPNACVSPNPSISQPICFTVTPNQPPVVLVTDNSASDTICYGSTITFTANALEAGTPTYYWFLDAAFVGTASIYTTLPTLLPGNHSVWCEITSSESCDLMDPVFSQSATSSHVNFYVQICTSVQEQNISAGLISVFPSPAINQVEIRNPKFEIRSIELYNVLGENIFSELVTGNPKQVTISVAGFPSGIYFVKVRGEKEESVAKFVKQ